MASAKRAFSLPRSASADKLHPANITASSNTASRLGETQTCRAKVQRTKSGLGLVASLGSREGLWGRVPALGIKVPNELWGACNAVSLAFASSSSTTQLRAASLHVSAEPGPQPSSGAGVSGYAEALDFKPQLSTPQVGLTLVVAASICAVVYRWTAPATLSLSYSSCMALLFGACLAACRAVLLEMQYKAIQRTEYELRDPDSRFRMLHGLTVHYKMHQYAGHHHADLGSRSAYQPTAPTAIHCYHGFGANTFSWSYVYKKLGQALQAQVTMHDMPGFGLTQRPASMSRYTLEFNGRLGRNLMDAELASAGLIDKAQMLQPDALPERDPFDSHGHRQGSHRGSDPHQHQGAVQLQQGTAASEGRLQAQPLKQGAASETQGAAPVRRVLMGHSLGAACAAAEAIQDPQGLSALILVAPAIVGFRLGGGPSPPTTPPASPAKAANAASGTDGAGATDGLLTGGRPRPASHSVPFRVAAAVVHAVAAAIARGLLWVAQPLVIVLLRLAVRQRSFWEKGLQNACCSPELVSADLVNAYRMPQLVRGWEVGLVRFLLAHVTGSKSFLQSLRDAVDGTVHMTQAERLAQVVAQHNIKVLIVHGAADLLVPLSNSRRLAALLPACQLLVFPACGHVPQEEQPADFVAAIQDFLAAAPAAQA
ncbi:hypothetical protein WJX72_011250 [[Myrmecia] bisecta]|uniref:AB hydrolase-1 domain-containing protein n=1 Tax=[Myrmecia] bisecta TaxID=41462 RepID=A0AAW1Q8W9_9CHLO